MQTQTSNTLHNAIMEAGGKDRPPMLAPGNYVQWKSIIKRYIDTKPNHELIHYCLKNPPYKYTWADKVVLVSEGSLETTTVRSQQATTRNKGKAIVNSPTPIYDQELYMVSDDDEMSKDKEIDKLMALIFLSFNETVQKVSNNDNYNVFAIESEHPEQSKSVHDTYPIEQDEHSVIIDSLDMSYDREQIDQNDDDDLTNEREIEDFKTKNKSLGSSNNHFKEANNKLSETNELMYKDIKKFQAELDRRNNVEYASKVEIDYAKAKGDLISYKMESQKSLNKYTQTINNLNQMISEMKKELSAHQETISILSQAKEAQIKLYKTREDKELDKVISLENKVK
nr:hypothetical protein [Tanacetum cinerariifolium]